ncbi:MAG: SGNH/GDSL hydrolase family protein [Pseudodesulfovibrio sp.]|uniref:SGNH/GDSL hydrolase family protein n=1 Tax=Pseudodesulfovibrio sp. TaxID=2035812 RepID=UPI003D1391CC
MLYFLGNCQMDFLSRAVAGLGHPAAYRVLASPLTYPSAGGTVPDALRELLAGADAEDWFHGRTPFNQFEIIAPSDEPPRLLVLNLFHENTPLLVHNRDGFAFYLDHAALAARPDLAQRVQAECTGLRPNPATYLQRYGRFLAVLRKRFPKVPILVASRLSHHPAFGPDPYSYLNGWSGLCREAPSHFKIWEHELGVRVLDADRVFAGAWSESDRCIEPHCPFLKIRLEESCGRVTGLHAGRDLEHVGSLWARLADKIAAFLETGRVEYSENEAVPPEWSRPWRPAVMDEETMIDRFATRDNYPWAEAVGAFFLDLRQDYTRLLAAAGEFMPVCHNTLHMIRNYGRIFKNPLMAQFCDNHRPAAQAFLGNGPLYQANYLARLDEIRAHALS